MRLIYICTGYVSVYDSQVLSLLDYMVAQNIQVTIIQGYNSEEKKEILSTKLVLHPQIDVIWVRLKYQIPINENHNIKLILNALKNATDSNETVIHVRGGYGSFLTKKAVERGKLSNPILIDVRGIEYEEVKSTLPNVGLLKRMYYYTELLYIKHIYKYLFRDDSMPIAITSVSPLINDYLTKYYPNCSYPKLYHPNIAGKQFVYTENGRKEIRERLGISEDDKVVICSSNGGDFYQKDHMVIGTLIENGYKVVNLSKHDIGISGCITTTAPFADMPKYLSAADIAILWRDDIFMNNSASPSKFSEFAAMGLYVIHNDTVSVASEYIKSSNAGILVREVGEIVSAIDIKSVENNRHQRIENGNKAFGIEGLGQSYIDAYNQIKK